MSLTSLLIVFICFSDSRDNVVNLETLSIGQLFLRLMTKDTDCSTTTACFDLDRPTAVLVLLV